MRNRSYDLPPLDQLEAFEAAARHLSFTKAADELALTQSAVSRQVAALESFFGVPLFQRLHRALRLSEAGLQLQRTVVDVLQQLHQTSAALRGERRIKTVVVTTTAGFAGLWLIPRLAGFIVQPAAFGVPFDRLRCRRHKRLEFVNRMPSVQPVGYVTLWR